MFDPSSPRSPRSPRSSRPGSARPMMSPRRPASAMGTRPSSASPAELCDRYVRDMESMKQMAAKGEMQMKDMDAYSFWELHKLKTQSRCIQRQDDWARQVEVKRTAGPGSRNDWYVLTGSPRPNLRSQQWLNDDMRSNLGGPPYFPAPELGELRPFSTFRHSSMRSGGSRPQTPQMRTPQGSRPTTPRLTARPSVGFSDQPTLSKADWVERANAMMTDEDKAEMQSAVSTVENQIASRFGKMRDAFKALDVDQSGSISREELQRGLKHWNLAEQSGNEDLIDNLMAACDKDGSGEIDYKEFVEVLSRDKTVGNAVAQAHVAAAKQAAAKPTPSPRPSSPRSRPVGTKEQQQAANLINSQNAVTKAEEAVSSRFRNMHQAFQYIDVDKSGSISTEELVDALKKWNIPVNGVLEQLMKACDTDGSGCIDYNEFVAALSQSNKINTTLGA
eukprot:scaffold128892_cov62-Phaeocystis_antarctica.AAC.2